MRNRRRIALTSAAERLFAARGISQVSLREINRESGARNAVALQYHFKDREGIVRAVIDKHYPTVERHRHELLDLYEKAGRPDLRVLSAALVLPSAAKLYDPDGGAEYLQISAEFVNQTGRTRAPRGAPASIDRWRALVGPFLGRMPPDCTGDSPLSGSRP